MGGAVTMAMMGSGRRSSFSTLPVWGAVTTRGRLAIAEERARVRG